MGLPPRIRLRRSGKRPALASGSWRPQSVLLALSMLALASGCATSSDTTPTTGTLASAPDGSSADTRPVPSNAYLSGIANRALSGGGNVRVQLVEGVAYVTGNCETAIDESAVLRKLRREPGVERIENRLQRNM